MRKLISATRLTGFVECLCYLGDDDRRAQGDHLTFNGYLGQMLNGTDPARDAPAVADGDQGLLAEGEGDKDVVDGVLQHSWDGVVVLGRDDQVGVALVDLVVPVPHDRPRISGVIKIADGSDVLGEDGQGPIAQVQDLDVETSVGPSPIDHPRSHQVGGPAGAGASDDDLQSRHPCAPGRCCGASLF
jgi:hypothetical protein